jgi:quercetin dioxygenase-like cupin family protein
MENPLIDIDRDPPEVIRAKILKFEEALSKHPDAQFGDQERMPLTHSFSEGLYVREIFMPKGMVITSRIHKYRHHYFVLQGRALVVTDEGLRTVTAPCYGITPAGTKRALVILEDTIWVTVHSNPTEERDINTLVGMLTAKTFDELPNMKVAAIGGSV